MTTTRDLLNDLVYDILKKQALGQLHTSQIETSAGFKQEVTEPEVIDQLVDEYNDLLKNKVNGVVSAVLG